MWVTESNGKSRMMNDLMAVIDTKSGALSQAA
jgi:hypothetical protein